MTLTFSPLRAMVMTYLRARVQGQRSVGSEDRLETKQTHLRRAHYIRTCRSIILRTELTMRLLSACVVRVVWRGRLARGSRAAV